MRKRGFAFLSLLNNFFQCDHILLLYKNKPALSNDKAGAVYPTAVSTVCSGLGQYSQPPRPHLPNQARLGLPEWNLWCLPEPGFLAEFQFPAARISKLPQGSLQQLLCQ